MAPPIPGNGTFAFSGEEADVSLTERAMTRDSFEDFRFMLPRFRSVPLVFSSNGENSGFFSDCLTEVRSIEGEEMHSKPPLIGRCWTPIRSRTRRMSVDKAVADLVEVVATL